jgi:Glycosyl transferase family 11
MVSFTAMGRMGNFLFECATAWAYARRHGLSFTVPHWCSDPYHNPVYLTHLRNPEFNPHLQQMIIQERQHQYQELLFSEEWVQLNKNIVLIGYWQTEKYFIEYRPELLAAFNFKWEPELDTVSIHVRRGDYVTFVEKHPAVSDIYYHEAINYFVGKGFFRFKVFSDDIPWCKQYFMSGRFSGVEFVFSEGNSIEEDMQKGSCCLHHINSSSTYSWWMAWLNRNVNKIVITPKEWFTPNFGGLDTSDIVPDNWIKI